MADKVAASLAPPHPDKVAAGKEIRSAYKRLALQLHPDKVAASEEADVAALITVASRPRRLHNSPSPRPTGKGSPTPTKLPPLQLHPTPTKLPQARRSGLPIGVSPSSSTPTKSPSPEKLTRPLPHSRSSYTHMRFIPILRSAPGMTLIIPRFRAISMDCDDSDFQSQNFQLIGEDNDGFPQSLQSYDPPKFEIDDHFQSHLRFDSLSETGLFLGIQGEENNWIDEFSPRNSAVGLDSSVSNTCSLSGRDIIWSNAPPSENAQILNSVGDGEINPQVMNTEAETEAKEDSGKSETKSSNVSAEQHGVSPDTPLVKKSDVVFKVSSLDQKFHSSEEVIALQCTVNEELSSSSGDVSKACLATGQPPDMVQSKEPIDISSTRNSSLDDCGCSLNKGSDVTSNLISCSTRDDPSPDNTGSGNGKLDNPLSRDQERKECFEVDRSQALQSENKQGETTYNLYDDCQQSDHHCHDQTNDNPDCVAKVSSELGPPLDSLMLANEESSNSMFSKNSDGLLEAIAYQVKGFNNDLKTGGEISTCSDKLPSFTVEGDRGIVVGINSVQVGTDTRSGHCDLEGTIVFSHGAQEYISIDDGLKQRESLTVESQAIYIDEESGFASSKAGDSDNNCSELCSSGSAGKTELSSLGKCETRMAVVEGDNGCRNDPSSSNYFTPAEAEESAEDESLGAITKKPTELGATGQTILKEPRADLLDNVDNLKSSSVHDDLAPISDTSYMFAKLNEGSQNHLEEKDSTGELVDSSGAMSKDCSNVIENTEFSSFKTPKNVSTITDQKSMIDEAVADHALEGTKLPSSNNSTNTQQLQSVSEVIEEDKEVALSSVPDSQPNEENAHISLLPIKISDQPVEAPDSDANVQAFHNLSYGLETAKSDEVQVSSPAQLSSLATCQSTKGENANLAPTINSNKLRCPETEINTLSSSADKLGQPGLPESNLDSCMLDPQGGNISPSEPNCGSPTVISGKECTVEMRQRENNSSLKDPAGLEITERSDRLKNVVQDSKVSTTSEGEQGFSFAVQPDIDTSKKDMNGDLEPLSKMQSLELPQENSQGHSTKTINQTTSIISKSVEGKKKQASARATRKVGISKGDVKEKSIEKQCKGRKITPLSTSTGLGRATRSKTDTTGVQQRLFVETGTSKAFCSQSIQTSNLPDLNTSAPLIFHQPFTDLQQVQLRAQIFVYGSLIQGVLPDEACMLPAFGGADGGRSVWEQAWRVASERLLNQKTPPSSSGTHLHYHSEQGITCSPLQSKTLNSSVGWKDGKVPVSATQSNMSLQSSFQSSSSEGLPSAISRGTHFESNQFPSPLLPYQTSQTRQYLTNSSPWLSPSPHHAPWGFSSQNSPFDSTSRYSAIAPTEITQAAPVRSSSKPSTTNLQLASTVSLLANQGAVNVSAALVASLETQNKAATPASVKNASVSDKSKKRKKISVSEELVPNIFVSKPQGEPTSSTFIDNTLSRSACLSLPSNSLTAAMSAGLVSSTSHATTMPYYRTLGGSNPHPGVFSKETCTHIEHSKLQADNASAYASAAVRHSQVIWEQMTAQRKIGFTSEFEEKLASAAVAAAAAASVAKAAAEVAKVASEAALQAKLMADEALSSSYCENITQNSESSLDLGKTLLASTPVSIPRVKDKISGPLIISAARETTRKRVEAATAAIKRAENLDAVLKAAEMVAEAVSHVGMVVSMGDPLPFSITELVEVGPGDHWKLHHKILKNGTETNDQAKENLDLYVAGDHEIVRKQSSELPAKHDERRKVSVEISHNNQKSIFTQEINQARDLENGSNAIPTDTPVRDPIQASSIETGSVVEVLADVEGLRGAWFSAFVLDVKDGKAYVCYNHLYNKDHDNLKEWVPLESESTQPPRIRVAHRVMSTIPEGTRKRRREAIGNFNWAVGDRVDVWMRDGWWEGVIIEKDKDDETKLTVRFPVGGDSSIVRAWNVRLSLIWKDGQWIEWSRFTESTLQTYEGDTPHEKRQKLGRLDAKSKFEIGEEGLGNVPRNFHASNVRKLEETKPLNLSAKDAIFSTGKNASEGSNNDTFKVRRAGLQKDGSKVVYGVPKPGKKRKFMEVSKHYTTDKTEKETETGDSIKFAKYLIPQASRLWRNSSKVDVKGKPTTNMNTRGAKSLRFQNVQAKTTVDKDKSFGTASVSNGIESSLKTSFSTEEKSSLETDSFHDVIGKVDVAVIESSLQPVSGLPTSKKFSVEHATVEKEKVLSAVDQLSRSEIQGAENSGTISADVIEPRRSNRRIQPTSRLLEGLQSSLIISKTPNATHDRGPKTFHKGLSTSRGQSHG